MSRVSADHPHNSFATDDFAVSADFLNRCSYFHEITPQSCLCRRAGLKGLLQYSAYLATFTVVAQVGFLHHAFVLMAHRVRLKLRHEVHRYDDENK